MPSWLKFLLALLGAGVLGLALLIGGGAWWVTRNKDRLIEGGRVAETEGRAFGRAHAKGQCIDDAIARGDGCGPIDLVCATGLRLRLTACMAVAADDGACADVPGRTEILRVALWSKKECSRRGKGGSQACENVMQGVVEGCMPREPGGAAD